MVEEPQRGVAKHHTMLIGRLNTLFVHDTSTRCSKVSDPTLPCTMNIVWEREECVTGARHPIQFCRKLPPFFVRQRCGHFLELTFKLKLLASFEDFTAHKQVDRIRLFSTFNTF